MVSSRLSPTLKRPCKISVDTPAMSPEMAIDHLSRPGAGPEAVNVNLHTHSSPSSKQAGDEPAVRDDGDTCSVTVGPLLASAQRAALSALVQLAWTEKSWAA